MVSPTNKFDSILRFPIIKYHSNWGFPTNALMSPGLVWRIGLMSSCQGPPNWWNLVDGTSKRSEIWLLGTPKWSEIWLLGTPNQRDFLRLCKVETYLWSRYDKLWQIFFNLRCLYILFQLVCHTKKILEIRGKIMNKFFPLTLLKMATEMVQNPKKLTADPGDL